MTVSNKPVVWLPFAAGGMLAALLVPVLMLVLLLDGLGLLPPGALAYQRVRSVLSQPLVEAAAFVLLTLLFWHAGHRLRMTLQDLGVRGARARSIVARACYTAAAIGTAVAAYALLLL